MQSQGRVAGKFFLFTIGKKSTSAYKRDDALVLEWST